MSLEAFINADPVLHSEANRGVAKSISLFYRRESIFSLISNRESLRRTTREETSEVDEHSKVYWSDFVPGFLLRIGLRWRPVGTPRTRLCNRGLQLSTDVLSHRNHGLVGKLPGL